MSSDCPPKGYWIECSHGWDADDLIIPCGNSDHSGCGALVLYRTNGTRKGMDRIGKGGTGWFPLLWSLFPWRAWRAGRLQYCETLADLVAALGTHERADLITRLSALDETGEVG